METPIERARRGSIDSLTEMEQLLDNIDTGTPVKPPKSVPSIEAEAFALGVISKMMPMPTPGGSHTPNVQDVTNTPVAEGKSPSDSVTKPLLSPNNGPATPENLRKFGQSVDALLG